MLAYCETGMTQDASFIPHCDGMGECRTRLYGSLTEPLLLCFALKIPLAIGQQQHNGCKGYDQDSCVDPPDLIGHGQEEDEDQ